MRTKLRQEMEPGALLILYEDYGDFEAMALEYREGRVAVFRQPGRENANGL